MTGNLPAGKPTASTGRLRQLPQQLPGETGRFSSDNPHIRLTTPHDA